MRRGPVAEVALLQRDLSDQVGEKVGRTGERGDPVAGQRLGRAVIVARRAVDVRAAPELDAEEHVGRVTQLVDKIDGHRVERNARVLSVSCSGSRRTCARP